MARNLSSAVWALSTFALLLVALPVAGQSPVGLDGLIGPEWSGITPVQVAYDPSAPLSQFDNPGPANHHVGYEIFTRRDNDYIYVALRTTGPTDSLNLVFANLSFNLLYGPGPMGSSSSGIGFEVLNDNAFNTDGVPPPPVIVHDTAANYIQSAFFKGTPAQADIIEGAFNWSLFLNNSLNVSNYTVPPLGSVKGVLLWRSQSFGYSAVGGPTFGPERLGFLTLPASITAPEPASLSLVALAGIGSLMLRRRKR